MKYNRGQVLNTTTLVMGGVMFVASWAGNYIFNSPAESAKAVASVEKELSLTKQDVASLKSDQASMAKWLERVEKKLDTALSK